MLGNSWQSISQARTSATEGYLDIASMMRDKDLRKIIKKDEHDKIRVGLAEISEEGRFGIKQLKDNDLKSLLISSGKKE
jgi:hypothetical protein